MSQKTKISIDDVKQFALENGCELLSKTYVNMKQKLDFKCKCGEVFTTTFDAFKHKNKRTCNKCTYKKISKMNTLDDKEVREYIESKDCKLLSKYKNAISKLKIKCKCGEIFLVSYNKFKNGQTQCKKCSNITNWNYKTVKDYVDKVGNSKLYSKYYKNRYTYMKFKCNCGNIFYTNFNSFLNSNKTKCDICGEKDRVNKVKKGIDYLKKYTLNNSDSILLSNNYNTYSDVLEFKCSCGRKFKTSFISFMHGKRRCDKCSSYNSKLENKVLNFLEKNNINYKQEYSFKNLVSENNYTLRFDFAIFKNKKLDCLIECDGIQHFKPVKIFGGKEKFLKQKANDERKNNYCKKNNIKLYRISYKEFSEINNILTKILL